MLPNLVQDKKMDLEIYTSFFRFSSGQLMDDAKSNKLPRKQKKDLMKFRLEVAEKIMATRSEKKCSVLSDSESESDETPNVKR